MSESTRVLIFPFPVQGHVNSMLKLAELLCLAGVNITFLNSDYNHDRLLRYTDVISRFSRYPGFEFKTFADGLPADHLRSGSEKVQELFYSVKSVAKSVLREVMDSGCRRSENCSPAVSCVIADGIMGFSVDVANEVGIPIILFRTASACYFWSLFCGPQMTDSGELPIKGDRDMDRVINKIPGMETQLRCRDLPSFYRVSNLSDPTLQLIINETQHTSRADGLILNTLDDLEGPVNNQIKKQIPNLYVIGPLHLHLKSKLEDKKWTSSSNSLFNEDKSCMSWLDCQPSKSVIYVSLGSITILTKDELMEFWYGLVHSKIRFLWVIRPGSISECYTPVPAELTAATEERGFIVEWAPQEEVLSHRAVGGFLTHSGWNSTLESVVAGVPMLCWPYFADQQINSRFVGEIWKLGIDMKDVCDRNVIAKLVKELMDERRDEFLKSSESMAAAARRSVGDGGSSDCDLGRLVQNFRSMSKRVPD